jgi:DNA-binding NarL/FixJ family response regulator
MMRAGLRAMLDGPDLEVVGEVALLSEVEGGLADADLLLVAGEDLLEEAAREVLGDSALAMVVLADDVRPARVLRSLPLHGWGIVSPDAPAAELRAAVQAAAEGLTVLPPPLAEQLLGQVGTQALEITPLNEPLTARELEVLELLSAGLPNKQIARKLQISEHTVKFHISSIYTKLGASSRTEAVSLGARRGLISF